MLSNEEKKAIEGIKKDDEYYDVLENIKQNKYNMWNVEKLMRDTTTGDYTEYEIAQSIVYFVNLIEKQSKEIEELKEKDDANLAYYDQIYQNGIYTGQKAVEYKIKAKIEEYDDKGMTVNLANRSAGKTFQQAVHYEVKKVLQSLLEKE